MKMRFYKVYSAFNNTESFYEFDIKQLRRFYKRHNKSINSDNLFYNGNFQYGLDGWGASSDNHFQFSLVATEKGDSALCVTCGQSGYSEVSYDGRPMICHKDVSYQLSFSYRIVNGAEIYVGAGWWVDEGEGWQHDLPMKIELIDSVWRRGIIKRKFKKEQFRPISLYARTTLIVKDLSLISDDTTGLPVYVDQLPDSVIHKYYSQGTINYFTAPRTDRWRYALELWHTRYNTKQKIFGQGFKYLEWYGEKFHNNPNRHDFPHNPIISSFLYSGIIGGVVYIIFLIMSLWLYWKRRKELGIFFIMYLCCMFFSMFSGSSHFSFPLFAFLSFLPFVEVKEKPETDASSQAPATCNCD